jgi:hypothetical protein
MIRKWLNSNLIYDTNIKSGSRITDIFIGKMMKIQKKEVSTKTSWSITCNRYVAYIDVMGFKDMVVRTSHGEIYKMMKSIESSKSLVLNTRWTGKISKLVTTTTYSDSIMLYSKDESNDALDDLITSVSALVYELFLNGIPHKGSIAYGKMTLDKKNSIFFGQPLIDAYLLQEELNFYGIIIHASAEKKMKRKKYNCNMSFVQDYLCPLKNGSSNHLTVYPIFVPSDQKFKKQAADLIDSMKELRYKTSGYLRRYIDNTELYLNSIIEKE